MSICIQSHRSHFRLPGPIKLVKRRQCKTEKNPKSVSVPSLYLEQIDTATENANTYPVW